jgi:hypothetical protein
MSVCFQTTPALSLGGLGQYAGGPDQRKPEKANWFLSLLELSTHSFPVLGHRSRLSDFWTPKFAPVTPVFSSLLASTGPTKLLASQDLLLSDSLSWDFSAL